MIVSAPIAFTFLQSTPSIWSRKFEGSHFFWAFEPCEPETFAPLPKASNANLRLLDLAYERGLIIYSRRIRGDGAELDNFMLAPPLIITQEQIGEMVGILDASLSALAAELDLPVNS